MVFAFWPEPKAKAFWPEPEARASSLCFLEKFNEKDGLKCIGFKILI